MAWTKTNILAISALMQLASGAQTLNVTSNSSTIVSIPNEYTYSLPGAFNTTPAYTFVNGTTTADGTVNALFAAAAQAPFISYDDEFLALLGSDPEITLVEQRSNNFAGEAGVWVKTDTRNEVWYTTWINDGPTWVEVLDLNTNTVRNLTTSEKLNNPNGGYLHQGKVYFSCLRDDASGLSGGVVSVDVETGAVETVLNSYFGSKFDNIDDVAWVTQPGTNLSYMYLTVLPLTLSQVAVSDGDRLPQGLWRWDPQEGVLMPVVSRTDFPVANGVRPSPDMKTLWLTDFGGLVHEAGWGVPAEVGAPAIYRYELDADMLPVNRRIFGVAGRMQSPDGIRVDTAGRVWTGEGQGVVVRNAKGKVIGMFNAQYFTPDPVNLAIVQFEMAGDTLVILGMSKLWTVKLAGEVTFG